MECLSSRSMARWALPRPSDRFSLRLPCVRLGKQLVTDVCGFVRNIAGYAFPVRLRALDRIQREVFTSLGWPPGDYASYVARG
jgi:hypothetical protein